MKNGCLEEVKLIKKNFILITLIFILILSFSSFSAIKGLLCPYCNEEAVEVLSDEYGVCQCENCGQYFLVVNGKVITSDGGSKSLIDLVVNGGGSSDSSDDSSSSSGTSSKSSGSSYDVYIDVDVELDSGDDDDDDDDDDYGIEDEPTLEEVLEKIEKERQASLSETRIRLASQSVAEQVRRAMLASNSVTKKIATTNVVHKVATISTVSNVVNTGMKNPNNVFDNIMNVIKDNVIVLLALVLTMLCVITNIQKTEKDNKNDKVKTDKEESKSKIKTVANKVNVKRKESKLKVNKLSKPSKPSKTNKRKLKRKSK